MKKELAKNRFPLIISGFCVALLILIVLCLIANFVIPHESPENIPTAILVIISAPSQTPESTNTPQITPTSVPVINAAGFGPGVYVEVSGTGGDGVRVRTSPGVDSETLFVAFEPEVFLIEQGPESADGYTWWFIAAPYDQTRTGWAVENYLTPLSPQNP